jgi:hypothetical protein
MLRVRTLSDQHHYHFLASVSCVDDCGDFIDKRPFRSMVALNQFQECLREIGIEEYQFDRDGTHVWFTRREDAVIVFVNWS